MTTYIVLNRKAQPTNSAGGMQGWIQVAGEHEGSSGHAAILAALRSGKAESGGEFVAVPARSWDPVKVEAKQAFSFS